MQPIHVDDVVSLRPFDPRDAEAIYQLIDTNREYLFRWMPQLGSISSAREEREALERLAASQNEGDVLGGAIEYRGRIVGGVSVQGLNSEDRRAALGFWIVAVEHDEAPLSLVLQRERGIVELVKGVVGVEIPQGDARALVVVVHVRRGAADKEAAFRHKELLCRAPGSDTPPPGPA